MFYNDVFFALQKLKIEGNPRVYVFQSDVVFEKTAVALVEKACDDFIDGWRVHGKEVDASYVIFLNRFLVFIINEDQNALSGCSKDALFVLIQNLQKEVGVQLLNRRLLAFWVDGEVKLLSLFEIEEALRGGLIKADTLFFDNMVSDYKGLLERWLIEVKDSWVYSKYKGVVL